MRKFILLITMMLTLSMTAGEDLNEIMEVLKYVESVNDPTAIGDGGDSFGVLQIQKVCVDDVNRYYGTYYTHEQMFDVVCAEEVFKLYAQMGIDRYVKRHGVQPTVEVIVRNHNGGIYRGYRINATKKYFRKYKFWKSIINLKS